MFTNIILFYQFTEFIPSNSQLGVLSNFFLVYSIKDQNKTRTGF